MILCAVCGSKDWIGCRPGQAAEPREINGVRTLRPAPAIPHMAWCLEHWRASFLPVPLNKKRPVRERVRL